MLAEAVTNCREILDQPPADLDAYGSRLVHRYLGDGLMILGKRAGPEGWSRYVEAVEIWRRAVLIEDPMTRAVFRASDLEKLARSLLAIGQLTGGRERERVLEEAVPAFEVAIRAAREAERIEGAAPPPEVSVGLAKTLWLLGRQSEAAAVVKDLLRENPDYRSGYFLLHLWAQESLVDFEMGYEVISDRVKRHPGDLSAQLRLVESLFTTARFDECLQRAIALQGSDLRPTDKAVLWGFEIAVRRILGHSPQTVETQLPASITSCAITKRRHPTGTGCWHFSRLSGPVIATMSSGVSTGLSRASVAYRLDVVADHRDEYDHFEGVYYGAGDRLDALASFGA